MRCRLFGLVVGSWLLTGCAQMAVVSETDQGRAPELLIASDLVNALMQVDGYHPATTRLQMQPAKHRFGKTLSKVLTEAGYEIQRVSSRVGDRFVEYTFSNRQNSAAAVPQTYQLRVGDVQVKRDYSQQLGRVQPASDLFVLGVDASAIRLNDHIFSVDGAAPKQLHVEPASQTTKPVAPKSNQKNAAFQQVSVQPNASTDQPSGTQPPDNQSSDNQSSTAPLSDGLVMDTPVELLVNGESHPRIYQPGDKLVFTVKSPVDARLSCYYQGPDAGIIRVYPNRFTTESMVSAGQMVHIPSTEHWAIEASRAGEADKMMCISVDPTLAPQMNLYEATPDLESLSVSSFKQILVEIENAIGVVPQAQHVSVLVN